MTLSNLWERWLCENFNLVLVLDFKGVGNKMVMHDDIFWEKC